MQILMPLAQAYLQRSTQVSMGEKVVPYSNCSQNCSYEISTAFARIY